MAVNRALTDAFFRHHPAEAARALEVATPVEIAAMVADMDSARVAPVVAAMDPTVAAAVLHAMDPPVATRLVTALPPRTASVLLRRTGPTTRAVLLQQLPARTASRFEVLLRYPAGSAGALLDAAVETAPPDVTVQATLERLHRATGTVDSNLYVIDRRGLLLGVVTLGALISAPPEALLGAIATRQIATLPATAGHAAIVTHPAWRTVQALPVVDRTGRFLGIVRHETRYALESGAAGRALDPAVAGLALEIGELAWSEGVAFVGDLIGALSQVTRQTSLADAGAT